MKVKIAEPFAIIPAWLFEEASPEALKLYGVLYLHGSYTEPRKTITKKALAEKCGIVVRTLDAWLDELLDRGVLAIESGLAGGRPNTYVLLSSDPGGRQPTAYPVGSGSPTGSAADDRPTPLVPEVSSEELPTTREITDAFDEFWNLYPKARRQGHGKAFESFANTVLGKGKKDPVPIETILDGVRRFAADPNLPGDEESRFIPLPSTWLNQGRWADGPLPPRKHEITEDSVVRLMRPRNGA